MFSGRVVRRALARPSNRRLYYTDVDRQYVMHPYTSMTDPLPCFPVKSAQGVHFTLEDGQKLLDGMSSWWAAVHGYRHPVLDEALKKQVDSMSHVMFGGLTHRPATELCKLLVDITPPGLEKVFLCDSGSVSVEVALKMAVQFYYTIGKPKKAKFLTITNGYHGDTFGAMSVCDPVNGMHSMFSGILARNEFVRGPRDATVNSAMDSIDKMEAVLKEKSEDIAGIIVEPIVQGAGGMKFYSPVFLGKLRSLCDKYDVLLVFDEIATGFGRTGTLFACQQDSESFHPMSSCTEDGTVVINDSGIGGVVVPDILCLGKALSGGCLTIGATLTNRRVCEGISSNGGVFMHGPTFMGNPLASAVALASCNLLLNSPWQERIRTVDGLFKQYLPDLVDLPSVRSVRSLGAIGVCELHEPVKDMAKTQAKFVQEGVWLRPFGKLLYSMPPFNSPEFQPETHVKQIVTSIHNVAKSL